LASVAATIDNVSQVASIDWHCATTTNVQKFRHANQFEVKNLAKVTLSNSSL
jgi:hypothetical protein